MPRPLAARGPKTRSSHATLPALISASLASLWILHAPACTQPEGREASQKTTAALVVQQPELGATNGTKGSDGAELYGRMCAICHGSSGEGYKADEAPAIGQPAFLTSVSDAYLEQAIAEGRPGTTMSAWAHERGGPLSKADVRAVVGFLRSLQKEPAAALDERPLSGDAQRGTELFARECARCHGEAGSGGPNVQIGRPALLASASNGFLRRAIREGRPGTTMQGYADALGEAAVEDLVSYLRSLEAKAEAPAAAPKPVRPPPIPLGKIPLHPKGPEPKGFAPYPTMVSVDQVHAELQRRARIAILDARAPSDYMQEHIAGAFSVPFYDPSPYLESLPKDTWLVCYCSCPHAESGELARKLMAAGFTKVTVLDEGLGVWKSKNYGTRVGMEP